MKNLVVVLGILSVFAPAYGQKADQPGAGPMPNAGSDYPRKPVRFVCPFPPGGAADMVTRMLAQRLSEMLKEQFVADNRGGAGGIIGVQIVAKAAPDGYTLLLTSSSNFAFGPAVESKLPYDPYRDFAPIALTVMVPNVLVGHPSLRVRGIKELIALARLEPNRITYASPGTGTTSHLIGVLFEHAARIHLLHVPYKGGGPAVVDLLGGHVQLLFGAISTSLPLIKTGKLIGLGVTSSTRSGAAPELPTIAESGVPGFEAIQWFGVSGPARLPASTVFRLNNELNKILVDKEFQGQLQRAGLDAASPNTPEAFQKYMERELTRLTRVFKEAGVHIDEAH